MSFASSPDSESAKAGHDPDLDIVTFDRPPVSEVVAGVGFAASPDLSIVELGRYWGVVADRFPTYELAPPIPAAGIPFPISAAPRLVLRNRTGTKIVQLQENWLLFNWVRDAAGYPRYRHVFEQFKAELVEFLSFVESRGLAQLTIIQTRLSYVNHIPKSDGWARPSDVGRFFPDVLGVERPGRYLPEPSTVFFRYGFDVKPGRLDVEIKNGLTRLNSDERLIADVGVSSAIAPVGIDSIDKWFGDAREVIVLSFKDLTSDFGHRAWGLHA